MILKLSCIKWTKIDKAIKDYNLIKQVCQVNAQKIKKITFKKAKPFYYIKTTKLEQLKEIEKVSERNEFVQVCE